jgi:hypothetical protein
MTLEKAFEALKISEAVLSDHDQSLYGLTYAKACASADTLQQAIRDMAAQIRDNEGLMRVIIGSRAVDLIKKYNHDH